MIRELFPRFSLDIVRVTVPYPGADPDEIEESICRKLEEALEGLEDVKRVLTSAKEGVGTAMIECSERADVLDVRDEVKSRVDSIISFPVDAERPIVKDLKFPAEVCNLALWGDVPDYQLKEQARKIKDEILSFGGITQVEINGDREYEISIEVSENKLRQYGLSFSDVSRVVSLNSVTRSGGTIRTDKENFRIRTKGRKYLAKEYNEIPVLTQTNGSVVRLFQVADIYDSYDEDIEHSALFNGKPSVSIKILKANDEDSITISKIVDEYLRVKNKQLPASLKITKWRDMSRYIEDRLDTLISNGKLGFLLIFFTLWIFLDFRLSFWVSAGVLISIAGGIGIMWALGQTLNMLTLFALIMMLGLIVDDAIVVGESIYVHRLRGDDSIQAATNGTHEVMWPVISAVITTIVAFIPLYFVGGIMGKFISQIPTPVIAALVVSLIESLFILPVHLRHLPAIKNEVKQGLIGLPAKFRLKISGGLDSFITNVYGPAIDHLLHWRYVTIAVSVSVVLLIIGLFQGGLIKLIVFPQSDNDFLRVAVELEAGTPIEYTREIANELLVAWNTVEARYVKKRGKKISKAIFTLMGSSIDPKASVGSNSFEITVEMEPAETRNIFYKKLVHEWQAEVGDIPKVVSTSFGTFEEGPPGKPVEVRFLSNDQNTLLKAGNKLIAKLKSFEGLFDIKMDYRPGKTEFQVTLRDGAEQLGFDIETVANHLQSGFFGNETTRVQRGQDDVRVKVRYPRYNGRNSFLSFENLRIRSRLGNEVPLLSIAKINIVEGQTQINRIDKKRSLTVSADLDTGKANSREVIAALNADFLLELLEEYPGLSYTTEGKAQESRESLQSLKTGFPLAVLAIFMIIATVFRSYVQPLIIMVTIPFGQVGAVFGHMIFNEPISMMSMFGMVALTGIVVNDAIVLIEAANSRLGQGMPLHTALCEAGKRRFRAIFLTTVTTFIGLTPIIFEKSLQAKFLIPMAISIAFGVLFATLVTLILVPCVMMVISDLRRILYYIWFQEWRDRESLEPRAIRGD